jgi:acetolactate synthase regulatory subunit
MKNKLPTDGNHDAFPCVQQGLTKRELFAAMAMQGLLGNPNVHNVNIDMIVDSVKIADSLIKALNK